MGPKIYDSPISEEKNLNNDLDKSESRQKTNREVVRFLRLVQVRCFGLDFCLAVFCFQLLFEILQDGVKLRP